MPRSKPGGCRQSPGLDALDHRWGCLIHVSSLVEKLPEAIRGLHQKESPGGSHHTGPVIIAFSLSLNRPQGGSSSVEPVAVGDGSVRGEPRSTFAWLPSGAHRLSFAPATLGRWSSCGFRLPPYSRGTRRSSHDANALHSFPALRSIPNFAVACAIAGSPLRASASTAASRSEDQPGASRLRPAITSKISSGLPVCKIFNLF